jgi:hypothetical protein
MSDKCLMCGAEQGLTEIKGCLFCQACRKNCALSVMIEFSILNTTQLHDLISASSGKVREALEKLFSSTEGNSKMSEATFKRCQYYHQPCKKFDCAFCNWQYQRAWKAKYVD